MTELEKQIIGERATIDVYLSLADWQLIDEEVERMIAYQREQGREDYWSRKDELKATFYAGMRALKQEDADRRKLQAVLEMTGEPKPIEVTADVDA